VPQIRTEGATMGASEISDIGQFGIGQPVAD
jgi:hypothetical protein